MEDCVSTIICAVLLVVIFLMLKNCLFPKAENMFSDEKDAKKAFMKSKWGRVDTEVSPQLLNMMYDPRYKQYGEGRGMTYNQ